ncbi:spermidine/putrescine import ATP-binding protein PotA [Deltaproteobacteria bacterium]|nr:spermidine/putrescine import ATP-binding protein PotA [Deltaproteobacteria bacterium]
MASPVVEFKNVSKTFGGQKAVRNISFHIEKGEFFSILGPSGCGKTTNLRLLAGFETPDEDGGEVRILDRVVNHDRPYERKLAMVFQNYALFPHLTVEKNVAFGLEQRGTPKAEIVSRVKGALEMVRLDPDQFGRRPPAALSGGQRQRVALARALVLEPSILLLDEPLGALDLKLRKEMQLELKSLNRRLGITFVYVTHDQEEALTMSDRIAVMDNARIAQLGSPAQIYEQPRTAFVARFIGESNFCEGVVQQRDGAWMVIQRADGSLVRARGGEDRTAGETVKIAVRPERVELCQPGAAPATHNVLPGSIRQVVYRGEMLHVRVALPGGGDMVAAMRNEGQLRTPVSWQEGAACVAVFHPDDARVLEEEPK